VRFVGILVGYPFRTTQIEAALFIIISSPAGSTQIIEVTVGYIRIVIVPLIAFISS
jgi:hypothetical protein